jgi:hypothetical protein
MEIFTCPLLVEERDERDSPLNPTYVPQSSIFEKRKA